MTKENLKQLFDTHPDVDEFYITSNGFAFKVKDHALDHARSLEDKSVEKVSRKKASAQSDDEQENEKGNDKPEAEEKDIKKSNSKKTE